MKMLFLLAAVPLLLLTAGCQSSGGSTSQISPSVDTVPERATQAKP